MRIDDYQSSLSERLHKYEGFIIGKWEVVGYMEGQKYLIRCLECSGENIIHTQTITDGHDLRKQYCKCNPPLKDTVYEMLNDSKSKAEIIESTGKGRKTIEYHIRQHEKQSQEVAGMEFYDYELEFSEIADALGVNVRSVRHAYLTGMKKIAAKLAL